MLSEAKHLSAHRERPFPFASLRASAHYAQGDNTFPILLVKIHHRPLRLTRKDGTPNFCDIYEYVKLALAARLDSASTIPVPVCPCSHR